MAELKTLDDFTPEIQAKIPAYIEKYTQGIFDGGRYKDFKREHAEALVDWNYKKSGHLPPVVLVAESPLEAQMMYNFMKNDYKFFPRIMNLFNAKNGISEIKNMENEQEKQSLIWNKDTKRYETKDIVIESLLEYEIMKQLCKLDGSLVPEIKALGNMDHLKEGVSDEIGSFNTDFPKLPTKNGMEAKLKEYNNQYLFTANVYSNVYCAWFSFIKNEFNIKTEIGETMDEWDELYMKSHVFSGVFAQNVAIVSKYPTKVYRDDQKRLHRTDGPAVTWGEKFANFDGYYVAGRMMPKWIYTEEITREKFINEKNADVRGGIYAVLGQKKIMDMLGAKVVDEKVLKHKGFDETVTLLKTEETFEEIDNQPFAWVKVVCPSTGTQYLLGVEPHHTDAHEAVASLAGMEKKDYVLDMHT